MRRLLFTGIAAAGLVGLGASQADAQIYGWGSGRGNSYYGHGYRNDWRGDHYHGRYREYRPHYDYHDTSHWDYHGPSLRRHYDHYDYVPGHYDFHRQGHWDRHW